MNQAPNTPHRNGNAHLYAFPLFLLLLAYAPIISTAAGGQPPNDRQYSSPTFAYNGRYASFQGGTVQANGGIALGNNHFDIESWAVWTFAAWMVPSYSAEMLNATKFSLSVQGSIPQTLRKPTLSIAGVGYNDTRFLEGWNFWAGDSATGRILHEAGVDISANFTQGVRNDFLLKRNNFSIDTNAFPYVFVRWKSTDHIARLVVYTRNNTALQVVVDSPTGTVGYGGGFSPDWTDTIFQLPLKETIVAVDLGLDSGEYANRVQGIQHATFAQLSFLSGELKGSQIIVTVNGAILLRSYLTARQGDVYTLGQDHLVEIPLNPVLLKVEDTVNVTIGDHSSWMIDSIKIMARTNFAYIAQPAWKTVALGTYLPPLIALLTSALGLAMARRLRNWLLSDYARSP